MVEVQVEIEGIIYELLVKEFRANQINFDEQMERLLLGTEVLLAKRYLHRCYAAASSGSHATLCIELKDSW
jgi:hypothetical protein